MREILLGSLFDGAGTFPFLADEFSIAWRVLDAEFWGVPQRRRRIFLVVDFGGQCAGEILFEREGLSRSFAESRQAWQGFTHSLACRSDAKVWDARGNGDGETCPTIAEIIAMATQQEGAEIGKDLCPTLTAAAGTSGNNQPVICYALDRASFNQGINAQYDIGIDDSGIAQTLVAKGPGAVCYITGNSGDIAGTLDASYYKGCGERSGVEREFILCLSKRNVDLRRLTPIECGRLQGMPDWWCDDIPHSDSAEYKMWGNGMALPCVMYVIEGCVKVLTHRSYDRMQGKEEVQL